MNAEGTFNSHGMGGGYTTASLVSLCKSKCANQNAKQVSFHFTTNSCWEVLPGSCVILLYIGIKCPIVKK